jgi:hypothetical protein
MRATPGISFPAKEAHKYPLRCRDVKLVLAVVPACKGLENLVFTTPRSPRFELRENEKIASACG